MWVATLMMTYLKHTGRYKHAQLNKKTLEEIQVLYIKEQERIADFVPIGSEEDERLIQNMNKKVADVHEEKVLEEPDSTKVEVKKEGNKENIRKRLDRRLKMKATKKFRMIFRSDESSRWIKTFSQMVKMFDRLDLEELHNLVMQRFESTTPEGVDLVLWADLRTMFDANTEDKL
ncbi:hypothetical protein Tco_0788315 [Tanacetum coccineum]